MIYPRLSSWGASPPTRAAQARGAVSSARVGQSSDSSVTMAWMCPISSQRPRWWPRLSDYSLPEEVEIAMMESETAPQTAGMEQWIAEARRGSRAALGQLLSACLPYLLVVA